jgi:hypothetical protein
LAQTPLQRRALVQKVARAVPGAESRNAARARAQGHQLQVRSKGAHKNFAMAILAKRGEIQAEVADADE